MSGSRARYFIPSMLCNVHHRDAPCFFNKLMPLWTSVLLLFNLLWRLNPCHIEHFSVLRNSKSLKAGETPNTIQLQVFQAALFEVTEWIYNQHPQTYQPQARSEMKTQTGKYESFLLLRNKFRSKHWGLSNEAEHENSLLKTELKNININIYQLGFIITKKKNP